MKIAENYARFQAATVWQKQHGGLAKESFNIYMENDEIEEAVNALDVLYRTELPAAVYSAWSCNVVISKRIQLIPN